MKKIKTILPKDPENLGLVTDGPVMSDIEYFRVKIDGTACLIKAGVPYCRYDLKLFKKKRGKTIHFSQEELQKKLPEGAIACQEPDEKSGHWPHWVPITDQAEHQYLKEGFDNLKEIIDGTYECIGPKLQGNPHGLECHKWVPHFGEDLIVDIDDNWKKDPFNFFKEAFKEFPWEGLVAYNDQHVPIGKIRRSDFGYKKVPYNKI